VATLLACRCPGCGEAAASPPLAPILVGLGVTSLSMSASAVADVRDALAAVTLAQCREMANEALAGRRSI
jgi:phosphotransferase system enzyme I (PtsI)